jgi:para-nitrobenzyl esterase
MTTTRITTRSDEPTTAPVDTPVGSITGIDRGATLVFKGIPFATAARFGRPQDVETLGGSFAATSFAPQAPQTGGALEAMLGGSSLPQDENCLALNVYTPACDERRRPVLVWIHGGAFLNGGGAMPWYDGSRLATRGDLVVVTLNYRLGALGYLGDRNCGTLDQVSALRWVQRNIGSFGGDPGNVTVFGESAGGSAAIALLATTSAASTFHRAWAMSPSISQLRGADHAAKYEAELLRAAEVEDPDALFDIDLDRLLAAQAKMTTRAAAGLRLFSPTHGTESIPDPILEVAAADRRPLVIGTTRDEFNLFSAFDPSRNDWTDDDVTREFTRRFGAEAENWIEVYRRHVRDAGPSNPANRLVTTMQTDEIFRWPALSLAGDRSQLGTATWMYRFDYTSSAFGGILGSCHAVDIPFAFDNLHRPGVEVFTGPGDERQAVADLFAESIIRFAREGAPGWAAYDHAERLTQIIGHQPELVGDPDPQLRLLWSDQVVASG